MWFAPGWEADEANRSEECQADWVRDEHCCPPGGPAQHARKQLPCSSCSSDLENFPFTLDYIISTSVETHRKYSCDWKLKLHCGEQRLLTPSLFYFQGTTLKWVGVFPWQDRCWLFPTLVFPFQVTWSDIAGLDDVITDLKDTVILPIKKKYLFENSRLLQPPKGRKGMWWIYTLVFKKQKVQFLTKGRGSGLLGQSAPLGCCQGKPSGFPSSPALVKKFDLNNEATAGFWLLMVHFGALITESWNHLAWKGS